MSVRAERWTPSVIATVAAVAALWELVGPVGLALVAMLAVVIWLELYVDAGLGG
jgi:hypothetical protein